MTYDEIIYTISHSDIDDKSLAIYSKIEKIKNDINNLHNPKSKVYFEQKIKSIELPLNKNIQYIKKIEFAQNKFEDDKKFKNRIYEKREEVVQQKSKYAIDYNKKMRKESSKKQDEENECFHELLDRVNQQKLEKKQKREQQRQKLQKQKNAQNLSHDYPMSLHDQLREKDKEIEKLKKMIEKLNEEHANEIN